jgi:hypothetical protein
MVLIVYFEQMYNNIFGLLFLKRTMADIYANRFNLKIRTTLYPNNNKSLVPPLDQIRPWSCIMRLQCTTWHMI